MVYAQNETSRAVWETDNPSHAFNHCRFTSTRLMNATGTWKVLLARRIGRSNRSSGCVSSKFKAKRSSRRSFSSEGTGGDCILVVLSTHQKHRVASIAP